MDRMHTTTPGPWKVTQPPHDPNAYDVASEAGGVLAKLPWCTKANAQLMAAAPDMLAALELIRDSGGFKDGTSVEELQRIAVAAIAKARGEA